MKTKRVLIYSDYESIRRILVNIFTKKEFEISECATYAEAISKLDGRSYNIVLTDTDIRNQEGIKFLERLRELTSYIFTPVMLLHSSPKEKLKEELEHLKIACYLAKPFDTVQFNQVVERLA